MNLGRQREISGVCGWGVEGKREKDRERERRKEEGQAMTYNCSALLMSNIFPLTIDSNVSDMSPLLSLLVMYQLHAKQQAKSENMTPT